MFFVISALPTINHRGELGCHIVMTFDLDLFKYKGRESESLFNFEEIIPNILMMRNVTVC